METLWQDIRYAVRQLVKYRQFTVAALLVLGLGIGANATIFGLMQGMLYRPLAGVAHSERLVDYTENVVSYPEYRDLHADTHGLIDLAGASGRSMTLSGDGRATLVSTQVVSGNFFDVLGVRAELGAHTQHVKEIPANDLRRHERRAAVARKRHAAPARAGEVDQTMGVGVQIAILRVRHDVLGVIHQPF